MRASRLGAFGASITTAIIAAACSGTQAPPAGPEQQPAELHACQRTNPGAGPLRLGHVQQGSPVALARLRDRTIAYVADGDSHALLTMDVDAGRQLAATPLAGVPEQVLVLADGRVAVSLRDVNRVQILEPTAVEDPLAPRCDVATPAEPVGLATTPNDAQLLVTSAWGGKLTSLSTDTLEHNYEVDLGREPRAVVVDDRGERAFVAHVVGAKMSVVDLGSDKHDVREIDLRVANPLKDPNAMRAGCQGFALAKSIDIGGDLPGGRLFAPMVTVDEGDPGVVSSGYGDSEFGVAAEAPLVSVIDAAAERTVTKSVLSSGQIHTEECLLPRSAAVSKGGLLYVTCLGNDALVEMDGRGVDPTRLERRRWLLPKGPTGVAIDDDGQRAVVWSQFDRALSIVSLEDKALIDRIWAERGAKSLPDELAKGRILFHQTDDSRISRDGRACASCHPDGREDALTWSTPVGARQTIMLAGRLKSTGPYSWLGTHDSVKVHVTTTFERLGGSGLDEDNGDYDALLAYLEAMPQPSLAGARVDPRHKALAEHGRELFFGAEQGCATCHQGATGTDGSAHDLKSASATDTENKFDTPSLRFVGGTAPYFHDGRYASLEQLLSAGDTSMGHTFHLPRRDVLALKAFLETL